MIGLVEVEGEYLWSAGDFYGVRKRYLDFYYLDNMMRSRDDIQIEDPLIMLQNRKFRSAKWLNSKNERKQIQHFKIYFRCSRQIEKLLAG